MDSDGSPKPIHCRMQHGILSNTRSSSKAGSCISAESWDQSSLPPSLHQASFPTPTKPSTAAKVQYNAEVSPGRPYLQAGASSSWMILPIDPSSKQVRPFDAFVDAPSPFAKPKAVAKSHDYPHPNEQQTDTILTDTSNSTRRRPRHTSPSPAPRLNLANDIDPTPDTDMDPNASLRGSVGYLDARTRATNLQHTRAEWTTWDFVDLFVTNLPPGIRTVDLWNNFKREGEVDLIDIFVTRSGQKDTKGRLRFRQVVDGSFFPPMTNHLADPHPRGTSSQPHVDTLSLWKMVGHGRSVFIWIEIKRRPSPPQVQSTRT